MSFTIIAGRYCEWEHKSVDKSTQSESFEAYQDTLTLSCQDGRPKLLKWTVPQDAPDTLYYQVCRVQTKIESILL